MQANQFLIVDNGHGALIDPGGNMTYNALLMVMQKYFSSRNLDYILASHADPDIIASVNKWFIASSCKVLTRNSGRVSCRISPPVATSPVASRAFPMPA